MPAFHKSRGAITKAANDKNSRIVTSVLSGEPAEFGRVSKVLSNGRFQLVVYDGKTLHEDIQAIPRGIFSARGKVRVRISVGDIVLLEGASVIPKVKSRGEIVTLEIIGCLSHRDAQTLFKNKRIHKNVYSEEGTEDPIDTLFDYDGVEDVNIEDI